MKSSRFVFLCLATVAVAACSSKPAKQETADEQAGSEVASTALPVATPSEIPTAQASQAAGDIPAVLQGRWGMVAADCTSTKGDAKGLLLIGPAKLTFYESVGKLGEVKERSDNRIRANFSFTGEGMEWNREMVLEAQNEGKALVRQEFGADAMPAPLKYARCP